MRQAFEKNEGLVQYINKDAQSDGLQVSVQDGSFGDIPVPDASVDIIIGESSRRKITLSNTAYSSTA